MTPRDMAEPLATTIRADALTRAVDACLSCVVITVTCADTCLTDGAPPRAFVQACLDCADRCTAAAAAALVRPGPDALAIRTALQEAVDACRACLEVCERHCHDHEPCAVCAAECRSCLRRCEAALAGIEV